MQQNKTAIVWFTNNLRVNDNHILENACSKYERVIACYCFDKKHYTKTQYGFKKTEKFRAQFLIESVEALSQNLKALHISLLVFKDYTETCIPNICSKYNADALFFQKEFTQEETQTIDTILSVLPKSVKIYSYYDQFLYHPDHLPFEVNDLPKIFTNFRKQIESTTRILNSKIFTNFRKQIESTTRILKSKIFQPKAISNLLDVNSKIPSIEELGFEPFNRKKQTAFPFKGGENEAIERLSDYFFTTQNLGIYKNTRNGLIGTNYSSKFSPWLANGCISARTIYWNIKTYEARFGSNSSTYWMYFELIWRDYFKYLALKHQDFLFHRNGIQQQKYKWKTDNNLIQFWINGTTTNDFVNANMIELKQTGWMSNRGRLNVASYFSKELHLDWRIGAAYFESMLLDYDVHSNYGNWQYVSGVGNDPRNRKFNVQLQAERYDANGKYRRTWLQPTLF